MNSQSDSRQNMLRPNELLVVDKLEGYVDMELLANGSFDRIEDVLTWGEADNGESRARLETVRPQLDEQTKLFEYYVAPDGSESSKVLISEIVAVAAHIGTILIAPNVYMPSVNFDQEGMHKAAVSEYMEETAEEYLRPRPDLRTLVNQNVWGRKSLDDDVLRTLKTVSGLILWQCENQFYQNFIDGQAKSFTDGLGNFYGQFPDTPPTK